MIDTCYGEAKRILESNRDKLDVMAAALMKYETIDEEQLRDIMAGKTPKPPAGWDDSLSNKPPTAPAPAGTPVIPAGQH